MSDDWNTLLAETPASSGFQSLAWISACRTRLPAKHALFVLVFRAGRDVVAIFPTEIGTGGALRMIGQGPLSNYLGPVYRPSHLDAVVQAFADFVARERRVSLSFSRPARAVAVPRPAPHDADRGASSAGRADDDLPTSTSPRLAAIYGRRRGKQRANIARKGKALERLGRLEFEEGGRSRRRRGAALR